MKKAVQYRRENEQLRAIIYTLQPMAWGYADRRPTYAPDYYNRAIAAAIALGMEFKPEPTEETVFARPCPTLDFG